MHRHSIAFLCLLQAVPALALGDADLGLEAVVPYAQVGDIVEVRLIATAQDDTPTEAGALDVVLSYDPGVLRLLGHDTTGAGYAWFVAGFLPDPDGINLDLTDGQALFTALSQINLPATIPMDPGLRVTTFRFLALEPSAATGVHFLANSGSFGRTQVLDFYQPGTDITGDISAFAAVTIGGLRAFCAGTVGACPCGNAAAPTEGCANSTGAGALLASSGSTSVAADDLGFSSSNLLPGQAVLLFAGLNAVNGGQGTPFGAGLRCAGGGVRRLGVRMPDPGGNASWGPSLASIGGWQAGDVRRFQSWYRDPASACAGFNFSHGLEAVFVP